MQVVNKKRGNCFPREVSNISGRLLYIPLFSIAEKKGFLPTQQLYRHDQSSTVAGLSQQQCFNGQEQSRLQDGEINRSEILLPKMLVSIPFDIIKVKSKDCTILKSLRNIHGHFLNQTTSYFSCHFSFSSCSHYDTIQIFSHCTNH